jgi:hypothetical protein
MGKTFRLNPAVSDGIGRAFHDYVLVAKIGVFGSETTQNCLKIAQNPAPLFVNKQTCRFYK